MHHLDRLILVNVVNQLDKALTEIRQGGPVAEVSAALWIQWAKSDLDVILKTNPEPAKGDVA